MIEVTIKAYVLLARVFQGECNVKSHYDEKKSRSDDTGDNASTLR
jgi:hypothetical protein